MAEWRPMPGFEEHYAVSNEGQVMRIGTPGRGTRFGRSIAPRVDPRGYASVMTCVAGKTKVVSLHRMVLLAFKGAPPQPGMEANHKDGVKLNCCLDNLEWATPSQNKIHMYQTGLRKRALTDEQVDEIRRLYASGKTSQQALAEAYGVSQKMVSNIIRGESYGFKLEKSA